MITIKKIWTWIKNHWYIPVIILGIIIFSLARSSLRSKMYEIIEKQRDNYKEQIRLLEESKEQTKKDKQKAHKKHKDVIKNIEKEYNVEVEKLDKEKKQEISDVVRKYENRPDDLAREVAAILSAEYLKTEWENKSSEDR